MRLTLAIWSTPRRSRPIWRLERLPRYRLDIEYDGAGYAGWQRQADLPSIQGAIEQAVFAFTAETVTLKGAGRTDAGVHASGQVAHLDLARDWKPGKVRDAINAHLRQNGERVSVLDVTAVSDEFDARFSATARHYIYRILNRRAHSALHAGKVWWVPKQLDAYAMQAAAQPLLGKHDFTTFRSTQCQANSPVRSLDRLDVIRTGEFIEVHASARAFLHNQVRSMVGSLKRVGEGGWQVGDVKAALDVTDRAACAALAPPEGLYLVRVDY